MPSFLSSISRMVWIHIYIYSFSRRFYPKRLTVEEYNKRFIIKRQINTGSAHNTKFQKLFRLVQARQGGISKIEAKFKKKNIYIRMQSNVDKRDEFSAVAQVFSISISLVVVVLIIVIIIGVLIIVILIIFIIIYDNLNVHYMKKLIPLILLLYNY